MGLCLSSFFQSLLILLCFFKSILKTFLSQFLQSIFIVHAGKYAAAVAVKKIMIESSGSLVLVCSCVHVFWTTISFLRESIKCSVYSST